MTVLTRIRGRVGPLQAVPEAQLEVLASSIALIAGKVATMGFGFLAWVVAARMYPATEVGLASGAVSAVTLCAQVALVGVGSAVITLMPKFRADPGRLLDTATSFLTLAAIGAAALFLLFAGTVLQELRVVAADPSYSLMFVLLAIAGTVGVLFDQASTTRRRGDQVLLRGVSAGATTLAIVALVAAAGGDTSQDIFFAWVIGGLVTWGVGLLTMARAFAPYRYRPRLDPAMAAHLSRVGFPNYLLTLAERAPGFVLPIAVTELLSPAANAHWYAAWMMAWVVFIIPIQVGMTSFAEIAAAPERTHQIVRNGIRTSLALGVAGAALMILFAGPALSLLGHGYASTASLPLRILVLGVVPVTFIQAYFSLCRATRRLEEAIVVGTISCVASIVVAAAAGLAWGLVAMALAWLGVQALTAVVAGIRLRRLAG
jgi:O-antigen/teichoic acid export membrane protein